MGADGKRGRLMTGQVRESRCLVFYLLFKLGFKAVGRETAGEEGAGCLKIEEKSEILD